MVSYIKFILLLTLFVIPLSAATSNFGYEQIKVFLFVILITVCGILWIINFTKHPFKIHLSKINIAALGFIGILPLTSFTGIDSFTSIIGIYPYFQGFIFYLFLYFFFLLVSWSRIKVEEYAIVVVATSVLVSLLAIKEWVLLNIFHQSVSTYAGRVVSTFGQPNFYAGFILLTLPFTYYLLLKTKNSLIYWLLIIIIFLSTLSIIISQSRTATFLLIFLILFWFADTIKKTKFLPFYFLITILIFIILVTKISPYFYKEIISYKFRGDYSMKLQSVETIESLEKRPYIWATSFNIISKSPFLGYGLENISLSFADYFTKFKHSLFEENLNVSPVLLSLRNLKIDRAHNYFLDLLLFSGYFGFLTWIIFLVMLLIKLGQKPHDRDTFVLASSLVIYLIWIQFQNQSMVHLVYFWLIVGLINQKNFHRPLTR